MSEPAPTFEFEGTRTFFRDEGGAIPPSRLAPVDDRLTADGALSRLRRGERLLYRGDFHNARQLLTALGRRLSAGRPRTLPSALETFREQRALRAREHAILGGVMVRLNAAYELELKRAPEVRQACEEVWGCVPSGESTVVPLRTLQGMLGAAEWRRKGLRVPGLTGLLHPHYGVFAPTRTEYVEVLAEAPAPKGARVFDVGTGTGVLGLWCLQHGARSVVGTDVEPRAVACARENAASFGMADRFEVLERDLFPDSTADLIICNPPWLPESPKNRMDRAVFDEGGAVLGRFLAGVPTHLEPRGEAWLILSDFAELLGLRAPDALAGAISAAGLEVVGTHTRAAGHEKSRDAADPLHPLRAREVTTLYRLRPRVG